MHSFVREVIFHSKWSELFIRVIKFLLTHDLPHSQKWLPLWNCILFTLIQRAKVKWLCITLNEGYLGGANRGSKNLYRFFKSKCNVWAFNEKTNFFGLSFLLFFLYCRSTKLLRLFSGILPAMFAVLAHCMVLLKLFITEHEPYVFGLVFYILIPKINTKKYNNGTKKFDTNFRIWTNFSHFLTNLFFSKIVNLLTPLWEMR